MLLKRQLNIEKQIENFFAYVKGSFIHLQGPSGGGKSSLALDFISMVKTDYQEWNIYYIEGKKNNGEAYSTITLSDGIKQPKTVLSGLNVNVGFSIPKLFTLGITGAFQKRSLLDPKINYIVRELNKNKSNDILIVADSFQYWDIPSQQFLMTLKNSSKNLLKNKNLKILLITDEKVTAVSEFIDIKSFPQKDLHIPFDLPQRSELQEVLQVLGYSSVETDEKNLDLIISITGGNMNFIKLFMESYYYAINTNLSEIKDFQDATKILDYRMEKFGEKKDEIYKILQVSSILKGDFKSDEVKFIYPDNGEIDTLLNDSCDGSLLKRTNHYIFSNVFIQELLYKKLNGKSPEFELKYSKYLQLYEPENYFGRAYYLSSADVNNEFSLEVISLYSLAYCRNMEMCIEEAERERLHFLIKEKVGKCKETNEVKLVYRDFLHLKAAYEFYFREDYQSANNELNSITSIGPLLLISEVKRMRLVIALLLDMNTENIRSVAEKLSDILIDLKVPEQEQWCKCNFTLFSMYSNKLDNYDESKKIVRELESYIRAHYNTPFSEYLGKIISRKAYLYESPIMAYALVQDSVEYFERKNDELQYYLALCNCSGIQIVIGKYKEATLNLNECLNMIDNKDGFVFPSKEKVYNNLFLSSFLSEYRDLDNWDESVVNKAIYSFEQKIDCASRESNAIMFIKLINLHLLKGDFSKSYEMLS
ncbi:hypothetical protein, partial [Paenibacillus helianthi]|uniref:hypothetical protein n=1 Tax=Paenibacillus helianthi TaxID=1349432 RepID=UPI000AFD30EB